MNTKEFLKNNGIDADMEVPVKQLIHAVCQAFIDVNSDDTYSLVVALNEIDRLRYPEGEEEKTTLCLSDFTMCRSPFIDIVIEDINDYIK